MSTKLSTELAPSLNAALNEKALRPSPGVLTDVRDLIPFAFVSAVALYFFPTSRTVSILALSLLFLVTQRDWVLRQYNKFFPIDIVDEFNIHPGGIITSLGTATALILQLHDPFIALAIRDHSTMVQKPLNRFIRTVLFVELLFNGSSEEKEQTAAWLRWMHIPIQGHVDNAVREHYGLKDEDASEYGYTNELKAWTMQTLQYATLAFQDRYGRKLTERARNAIVLEYSYAGYRLGIPEHLLAKDYESFQRIFRARLDKYMAAGGISDEMVGCLETAFWTAPMTLISRSIFFVALFVGHGLLPLDIQEKYQFSLFKWRSARLIAKVLDYSLWLTYPFLPWVPLRGILSLCLILEKRLRPVFKASLSTVHKMDIRTDRPTLEVPQQDDDFMAEWLDGGRHVVPASQLLLRLTAVTMMSKQQGKWLRYPWEVSRIFVHSAKRTMENFFFTLRAEKLRASLFSSDRSKPPKLPIHVGLVMDGNRRYARRLGQPVLYGHGKGAITASNVLEWWVKYVPDTYDYPAPSRFLPKAITLWAFSSENFNRPDAERDGLLHMMAAEFRSLAHTAFIHLFRIQVKVIGSSRDQLPPELVDAIELLEESTAKYDNLFLQLAVGYGGRREIVDSVNRLLAQNGPGKEVVEISEADITRETYCGQVNIPPCQLIIRTSERRTSGFFLWDTQIAELFFIDKLWPELNEIDWLNALRSYAHREYRGGL